MSQFTFLQTEFPTIYESAHKAFKTAYRDPRTACFYGRRALELMVNWLYKYDTSLNLPYQDNVSALIHEPTFKNLVGEAVFNKAKLIIKLGNNAVHKENKVLVNDGITTVKEFFHIAYWLVHTYGRTTKPEPGLTFDVDAIPKTAAVSQKTVAQLQKLGTELKEKDEKLSVLLADKNTLDETIKQLRAELASVKQANTSQPDTHDYSEQQTRDIFIDLLLKEAGWALNYFTPTPLPERSRREQI